MYIYKYVNQTTGLKENSGFMSLTYNENGNVQFVKIIMWPSIWHKQIALDTKKKNVKINTKVNMNIIRIYKIWITYFSLRVTLKNLKLILIF